MNLPVELTPEAADDLAAAESVLEQRQAGSGRRMLTQVVSALPRLAVMPEMYGKVWEDIRAFPVRKTRYVVYYRAFPDRVEVLAVIRGDRDPAVWQGRA